MTESPNSMTGIMDATTLEIAEKQAAVCRAMGNARRLVILWMISREELSVTEIARRAGSSMQNVSQHLHLLKKAGIVCTRRHGQTIYYRTADNEFIRQCHALLQAPEALK
jgi:DNA-binding transcriptional ArsR family regulator